MADIPVTLFRGTERMGKRGQVTASPIGGQMLKRNGLSAGSRGSLLLPRTGNAISGRTFSWSSEDIGVATGLLALSDWAIQQRCGSPWFGQLTHRL